jgi:hypothetical protein
VRSRSEQARLQVLGRVEEVEGDDAELDPVGVGAAAYVVCWKWWVSLSGFGQRGIREGEERRERRYVQPVVEPVVGLVCVMADTVGVAGVAYCVAGGEVLVSVSSLFLVLRALVFFCGMAIDIQN